MPPTAPRPFHLIAKPIGPLCNLDCGYCFYVEKHDLYPARRTRADWTMSAEVLEVLIRDYIAAQPGPVVSFAWQGGEPTLLGVEFFERVVALQQRYAGTKRIENAIQTNGVLLDDRWGRFLAEHRFLVGISIDGPRDLHDRYRVDKGGAPSFDRVMRGLAVLKGHAVSFNTLTVVHRDNASSPLEVYRFLRDAGSRFLQFIPIVEREGPAGTGRSVGLVSPDHEEPARVTSWSVLPEQYGGFLCSIFDEWVRHDVGRVFVQAFDVALESWVGHPQSVCVFTETCGAALAVEHNGDLYSCDHYVYPAHRLGSIMEQPLRSLVAAPAQAAFGAAKRDRLPGYCQRCDVRFACHGECPKHRFTRTPDGEEGLNYLCAGYKRFFAHITPAMVVMAAELANGRPPANVMAWTRQQDARRAAAQTGRNDPCPCGSGRKFKKCCGA
ncbi:MAG: anaerobic sulfatase maturase [Planctomycetes bacterium]|nr:anaerobic sulfatase maturase [Planctomycetota bacterium]